VRSFGSMMSLNSRGGIGRFLRPCWTTPKLSPIKRLPGLPRGTRSALENLPEASWIVERLDGRHDRKSFDCGNPLLSHWLRTQASQYEKKDLARTYVAVSEGHFLVLGYSGEIPPRSNGEPSPEEWSFLPSVTVIPPQRNGRPPRRYAACKRFSGSSQRGVTHPPRRLLATAPGLSRSRRGLGAAAITLTMPWHPGLSVGLLGSS